MFQFTLKRLIIVSLSIALVLSGCTVTSQTDGNLVSGDLAISTTSPNAIGAGSFNCDSVTEIPISECNALVAFYEAAAGPAWLDNSGWMQTATPCSWFGVSCVDNHVDALTVFFNNLQGQLTPALAGLSYLRVLDLHNNAITGPIPPEIGNLSGLEQLDLSANKFTGSLPAALGDLAALQWLQLPYNELSGPIPTEIGQISTLRNIDLSHNELSGEISDSLANIKALESFRLNDNHLEGAIPFGLGDLTALTELDLTYNQLTGTIPSALYQVPIHRFWGNKLDGTIFLDENGKQDVNYLGAVFTFDQNVADSVFPELVNVQPISPWPGTLWVPPEHIVFTFAAADGSNDHAPLGLYLPSAAELHIYPTAGLNVEVQPIVAALQQLLTDRPDLAAFTRPNGEAPDPALTMLPPSNAQQMFRAQAQYITFAEGSGVRYLTQLSQGPGPINNQELFYTFQGLTNDGATYVAAYFPVSLADLLDSARISDEEFATIMEDWQGYVDQTVGLLTDQPTAAFTPDLAVLDALINSLTVSGTTAVPQMKVVWPDNVEVVDSQPILQWEGFPGAASYHVIVLDDIAYPPQAVLDQTVVETVLPVNPPLAPGHYSWTILAQDDQDATVAELTSNFIVPDNK